MRGKKTGNINSKGKKVWGGFQIHRGRTPSEALVATSNWYRGQSSPPDAIVKRAILATTSTDFDWQLLHYCTCYHEHFLLKWIYLPEQSRTLAGVNSADWLLKRGKRGPSFTFYGYYPSQAWTYFGPSIEASDHSKLFEHIEFSPPREKVSNLIKITNKNSSQLLVWT